MFLQKLILGVSLAAPIGPVTIEMIRRGLHQGFWSAFVIRMGGAIANFICLLLAFFGLTQLGHYPQFKQVLGLMGASLLIYMGIKTLRAKKLQVLPEHAKNTYPLADGLKLGFTLGLFNPVGVMFWFGLFIAQNQANPQTINASAFLENLLIIVGVLSWGALLSFCLTWLKKYVTPKTMYAINQLSGFLLLGYGLKMIITLL